MLFITFHVILWLLQSSCSIFIDIECYNHASVFDACFTNFIYITVILAVMLKICNFYAKKFAVSHIAPMAGCTLGLYFVATVDLVCDVFSLNEISILRYTAM